MSINGRGPTLVQLRAFLAVADLLHFRDAAAELGTSQPALSAAVAALEEALGVQLVERTTRRVLLTAVGAEVAAHARSVLEQVQQLVDTASAGRGAAGSLRVGVIPTVGPYLLPVVLAALRRELPAVTPHVHEETTGELDEALAHGRIDVAVVALPSGMTGVREIPLYDEDLLLVVPAGHRLAGREDVRRRAIGELDMLLLDEGHCLRDQTLDLCREAGARPGDSTYAASLGTAVQLVSGGLGATVLPESAVAVETRRASIGLARFAAPAPSRRIGLVHRASSARGPLFDELAAAVRRAVRHRRMPVRLLA